MAEPKNHTKKQRVDWDIDIAAKALEDDAAREAKQKSERRKVAWSLNARGQEKTDSQGRTPAVWRSVGFVLVLAQAVTSVLLIISLITMNIISGPIIFLVIGVLAVLLVFSAVKLLIQKKTILFTKVACALISAVCITLSIFAYQYTDAFNSFLNRVTERKPETKTYNVVVLNESEIRSVSDLNDKSVGFLKTDEKAGNAEQHLKTLAKFEANFYEDFDTLTRVLTGKIVDAVTLEADRVKMLKEESEDLKNIRIIYTFEIEIESENKEIVQKEVTKEPFILYISGTDSRAGVHATARSDVNIVAVVNPSQGRILLVSIPRDTYVQLHGTTGIRDKLTHAGVYGINMSKATIEDFLGISIDYTLKVSFDTVVSVVDQIDGITIDSDTAMTLGVEGKDKKCTYTVGLQEVDGDCALRFARERKSYTTGDRHRGENQMQVISAIISKLASSRNYLLKVPAILDIAADSFETSLSRDNITDFVRMQLSNSVNWEVETVTVDGAGSMQGTYSMGASRPLYVMLTYPKSLEAAQAKIAEYLAK